MCHDRGAYCQSIAFVNQDSLRACNTTRHNDTNSDPEIMSNEKYYNCKNFSPEKLLTKCPDEILQNVKMKCIFLVIFLKKK